MTTPEIKITVNGRQALTYNLAAQRHDSSPDAVRMALKRAGVRAIEDVRLMEPVFYATEVKAALTQRKGRGAPGVPRPHMPPAERDGAAMGARLRSKAQKKT